MRKDYDKYDKKIVVGEVVSFDEAVGGISYIGEWVIDCPRTCFKKQLVDICKYCPNRMKRKGEEKRLALRRDEDKEIRWVEYPILCDPDPVSNLDSCFYKKPEFFYEAYMDWRIKYMRL